MTPSLNEDHLKVDDSGSSCWMEATRWCPNTQRERVLGVRSYHSGVVILSPGRSDMIALRSIFRSSRDRLLEETDITENFQAGTRPDFGGKVSWPESKAPWTLPTDQNGLEKIPVRDLNVRRVDRPLPHRSSL